jgi:hypothetical protein
MGVFVLRNTCSETIFIRIRPSGVKTRNFVFFFKYPTGFKLLNVYNLHTFLRKAGESWLSIQSMCHFLAVLVSEKKTYITLPY